MISINCENNALAGLETLLRALNNWFPARGGRKRGTFVIENGALELPFVAVGQYYRVSGSVFNDGLHLYGRGGLTDETFAGEIAALAIPGAVIELAGEIGAWRAKNPESDKTGESFGGYSYSRAAGETGWRTAFAARMAPWRRPHEE